MHNLFPVLEWHLKPTLMLLLSWLKGQKNGAWPCQPAVIRIDYSHGLAESNCLSADATRWGLKFTHLKKNKACH